MRQNHPCPEVLGLSRLRLLPLALRQPRLLVRMTRQGVLLLRPWTLRYLGSVGGEQVRCAGRLCFTLSDRLDRRPPMAIRIMFLLPGAIGVLCLVAAASRSGPTNSDYLAAVLVPLVLCLYTVFCSSLLGDGYFEFQKHTHLFFSFYLPLAVILGVAAARAPCRAARRVAMGVRAKPEKTL